MDAHTNVESMSFSFDGRPRTLPIVYMQEPTTKVPIPIPIPDINPLNPPLGGPDSSPPRSGAEGDRQAVADARPS